MTPRFFKSRLGVANTIFATAVIVLIAIAAVGYGLYATSLSHSSPSTTFSSSEEMMTSSSETMLTSSTNSSGAFAFTAKSGAMISNAWLVVAPLGMHDYAISIHAEGLESNATYLVEGPLASGSMQVVPISNESMSMNHVSSSEFQSNANGTGTFWIELSSNPSSIFEEIELALLPGMSMQNAMVVATASFTSMSMTTSAMTGESMATMTSST